VEHPPNLKMLSSLAMASCSALLPLIIACTHLVCKRILAPGVGFSPAIQESLVLPTAGFEPTRPRGPTATLAHSNCRSRGSTSRYRGALSPYLARLPRRPRNPMLKNVLSVRSIFGPPILVSDFALDFQEEFDSKLSDSQASIQRLDSWVNMS
jgi:hypothetical protein